jgi:hypothetical protein
LHVQQNLLAIQQQLQLAGWRIYVTNVPGAGLSLIQATALSQF